MTFSPTHLANFLACRHTLTLELEARSGLREKPTWSDPLADQLRKRGEEHERRYINELREQGLSVEDLTRFKDPKADHAAMVARTLEAMCQGFDVIVQAPLGNDTWFGYADVLRKVPGKSNLGDYHYEAHDTKLARETRGGAILQLCIYTELLGEMQGFTPGRFLVVTPVDRHEYRFAEVAAYYRLVRAKLLEVAGFSPRQTSVSRGQIELPGFSLGQEQTTYPDPVEHCSVCRWWQVCDTQRRKDDHIQFVANLGRNHKREFASFGVSTLTGLAEWTAPDGLKPSHGSRETLMKLQDQASLQLKQRQTKEPQVKLLPIEPHVAEDGTPLPFRGLKRLPETSPGDLYLDFEGDPFGRNVLGGASGEGSREYLTGLGWIDAAGAFQYRSWWAVNDDEEKSAFEALMDEIARVIEAHPAAHVYHYAPYEPSAIKRLSGRYASRTQQLDELLRGGRFVDLYAVTRESLRAGVESYSIKEMEQYYGFTRDIDLRQAGRERQAIEVALESGDPGAITTGVRAAVEGYNRDDVRSTWQLHRWLEAKRDEAQAQWGEFPRPQVSDGEAPEKIAEREQRVQELRGRLLDGVPVDRSAHSADQDARYLMAYLLDWHRREKKSEWWDFFRMADLEEGDLLDERKALAGLEFVDSLGPVISEKTGKPGKTVRDRYRFPYQECDIKAEDDLYLSDAKRWATVVSIDRQTRSMVVQPLVKRAGLRPSSCFAFKNILPTKIEDALYELGTAMVEERPSRLPMRLLRAEPPPTRDVLQLQEAVLAIQGPPGTGKTYSGGVMICDLVAAGKSVGVTANSHPAICNLLKAVRKESVRRGMAVPIKHIDQEVDEEFNDEDAAVIGGTAWYWTREDTSRVDVLFVDEAGQMSLANTLACTVATGAIVLLGDPQQLDQPTKGVHPDGVGGSALEHFLAGHKTMPKERGEFLEKTRRLVPSICDFTSECFYEDRLKPLEGLERQVLQGVPPFTGAGLRIVHVDHDGNRNASDEEVAEVVRIVTELLAPGSEWVTEEGKVKPITLDDILIVAPYNAQVSRLTDALPAGARVGTVDKFQGQEAPVVIYSMATSRPEDAPRGLGFLYSLNRFNVATSRARCMCILVANPRLFEPDCQTPRQMELANAMCRYKEIGSSS